MSVSPAQASLVESIAKNYPEVDVRLSHETTAAALCPSGSAVYLITHGGCSCDLCFEPPKPGPADTERQRAKLKTRGWSHSKIERAISESSTASGRNASLRAEPYQSVLSAFHALVSDIAATSPLTLFRHMYHGAIATEQLPSAPTSSVSAAKFSAAGFPPDTLVSVSVGVR